MDAPRRIILRSHVVLWLLISLLGLFTACDRSAQGQQAAQTQHLGRPLVAAEGRRVTLDGVLDEWPDGATVLADGNYLNSAASGNDENFVDNEKAHMWIRMDLPPASSFTGS